MASSMDAAILPGPRTRDTEGEKCNVSRDEARGLDWLPWSSNGLEHGLKLHKIAKNGYVYETGDRHRQNPGGSPKRSLQGSMQGGADGSIIQGCR